MSTDTTPAEELTDQARLQTLALGGCAGQMAGGAVSVLGVFLAFAAGIAASEGDDGWDGFADFVGALIVVFFITLIAASVASVAANWQVLRSRRLPRAGPTAIVSLIAGVMLWPFFAGNGAAAVVLLVTLAPLSNICVHALITPNSDGFRRSALYACIGCLFVLGVLGVVFGP